MPDGMALKPSVRAAEFTRDVQLPADAGGDQRHPGREHQWNRKLAAELKSVEQCNDEISGLAAILFLS